MKGQSEFMHWAKTRPKVKFDLGLSGILNLPIRELDFEATKLELHGQNAYGYEPLVTAIARHRHVRAEQIVSVAGGTSMANHLAMAALIDYGDEVLIEEPSYDPLLAIAEYLGANIQRFPRTFENAFQIDLEAFEKKITKRTRLIVLTNLHNPSSALTDETTLRRIGELARSVEARVLVDEVYLEALFERSPPPAISLGSEFIVTSSLTKGYGLSGVRCGWILAEEELAERIRRLDDIFGASAPYMMEQLSFAAIRQLPKISARAKAILETNRQTLRDFLDSRHDLHAVPISSGTTSFPRVDVEVEKLDRLLLEKYDTSVVPGRFFESPQHIRIGMCCEPQDFSEGLARLGAALDEMRG